MAKKIYVVRWLKRIDGEEECGNFATCYTDEARARKAMLEDYEYTYRDWLFSTEDKDTVKRLTMGPNRSDDPDTADYAGVWVEDNDTYDYHDWWIDKLDLED